ncbi:SCO4225 family membrane protein [Streptomyces sp. NPDC057638]|uniref:SCO4225 family membrane protein n=1 Tax=Streptomyces sp. NPDC057638 TaxID=3346190 RepID=UPI003692BF05
MNARTITRLTFANPASAAYLAIVGVAIACATAVTVFAQDPGFVWVWPALVTAPVFFLTMAVITAVTNAFGIATVSGAVLIGGVVVSALVQSFALGLLLRMLRGRRSKPARPRLS